MIRRYNVFSLENESELEELIKLQKEKENGDMFDETYMQLKQDQLVETKKEKDAEAAEANNGNNSTGQNQENGSTPPGNDGGGDGGSGGEKPDAVPDGSSSPSADSSSDSSGGSSGESDTSETSSGSNDSNDSTSDSSNSESSNPDSGADDILKGFEDLDKDVDDSKAKAEDDKKEDKDKDKEKEKEDKEKEKEKKDADKEDMKDKGVLKMPSKESYLEKYDHEYKPLRLKDDIFNGRYISTESFAIGETYKTPYKKEKFIDIISIEELIEQQHQALGEATGISMVLGDILTQLGGHNRYSFEDLGNQDKYRNIDSPDMVNWVGNKLLDAVKWGANKAKDTISSLGKKGFEYGEIAMRHIAKNVMTILDKTMKGLHTGTQALIKYIKERPEQFKHNRALLTKAGEIAKELQTRLGNKSFPQREYKNEKIIDSMKINGKFLPKENSQIAHNAATCFYENFIENVTTSTKAITNLINLVKTELGRKPSPDKAISIPIFKDFIKKDLDDYKPPEGMLTVVYKDILPGDLLLVAYLPDSIEASDSNEKLQKATEIYKGTSLFLAMSTATYQKNASARYIVDIDELIEYIEQVKKLCDYCINCQDKLETYNKLRDNIKEELKDYTKSIFRTDDEITVQNSLIEFFTPNITLLDNLSTKGTYVVDTYLKKHVTAATQFINDCLKDAFSEEGEGIVDDEGNESSSDNKEGDEENKEGNNTEENKEGNNTEENKEENSEENKDESENKEEDKSENNEEEKPNEEENK